MPTSMARVIASDKRKCPCGAEVEIEITDKSQTSMLKSISASFKRRHQGHLPKWSEGYGQKFKVQASRRRLKGIK